MCRIHFAIRGGNLFCHVVQVGHHVVCQVVHRHHRAADRLGDRGGNLLIELRLQENDLHVVVAGLGDEAEDLPRRRQLALDLDRLLPQAVGVGKVSKGRVEDIKRLPAVRRQASCDAAMQGVEFGVERFEVGLVDRLVPRIGPAEGRGHVGGHRLQQRRREPDMGIGLAFVVVVVMTVMPSRGSRPQGNSGRGIDDGKVRGSPGNMFDQAVFERHADAKEEPCLAERDHLPRRGLEDMRILPRLTSTSTRT